MYRKRTQGCQKAEICESNNTKYEDVVFIEIKVPKEIRSFQESVFFGLSMRQFICSLIGVAAAVAIYFGLADALGREMVSWLCVLAAAPFAVAGFFSYNGMTLGKFVLAWVRSEFVCAGPRKFVAENYYYQMLCGIQAEQRRRGRATRPQAKKQPLPKRQQKKNPNKRRRKTD
jgi:hypothetical protein